MKSHQIDNIEKTILVISDIHLGAGDIVGGKKNILEDFHNDQDLIDFFSYYSSGVYNSSPVELIINGDFFDFLAIPFIEYFDDEFWSEEAALEKFKMIANAHKEVLESLKIFLGKKDKSLVYVIGNHDGEFLFESLRENFLNLFQEKDRNKIKFLLEKNGEYCPGQGIIIKHGHEYEIANQIDLDSSIIIGAGGRKYFLPPWGSYYVTRVINKFKEERSYINQVRPIKKFIISGMIYDTLFTLRFILANLYYIFMVRFILYFKYSKNIHEIFTNMKKELKLFQDSESLVEDFFEERKDIRILIMGHTHDPIMRTYSDGAVFINTGTWTKMHYLDFDKQSNNNDLTYAKIHIKRKEEDENREKGGRNFLENIELYFNVWKGRNEEPFREF